MRLEQVELTELTGGCLHDGMRFLSHATVCLPGAPGQLGSGRGLQVPTASLPAPWNCRRNKGCDEPVPHKGEATLRCISPCRSGCHLKSLQRLMASCSTSRMRAGPGSHPHIAKLCISMQTAFGVNASAPRMSAAAVQLTRKSSPGENSILRARRMQAASSGSFNSSFSPHPQPQHWHRFMETAGGCRSSLECGLDAGRPECREHFGEAGKGVGGAYTHLVKALATLASCQDVKPGIRSMAWSRSALSTCGTHDAGRLGINGRDIRRGRRQKPAKDTCQADRPYNRLTSCLGVCSSLE